MVSSELGGHVSSGLREWGEIYETPLLATGFMGGARTIMMVLVGIMDRYATHQSDRLQQAMVNHVVMIRTFKGICSELPEMQDDNGRLLVHTSEVYYTGYSLGGTEGRLCGLTDVSRGACRSEGQHSLQIERCTQYNQFDLMESVIGIRRNSTGLSLSPHSIAVGRYGYEHLVYTIEQFGGQN